MKVFGGIEGGGTKTIITLINESGDILSEATAGCSNPWLLSSDKSDGFMKSAKLMNDLIIDAWNKIENKNECELVAVGVCISGGDTEYATNTLKKCFTNLNAQYKVYIANDSLAPIFTASKDGGIVIISGTGSICVLLNPLSDSKPNCLVTHRVGGWGHLLGDEGSAYWIAQKAIKYAFDVVDNFIQSDDDINALVEIIKQHFNITELPDLLSNFYSNFQKDSIASITIKLATAADKIPVLKRIFEEAGFELARHLVSIYPKIDEKLLNSQNGLSVVCTGSVFKSWNLLKPGFIKCLQTSNIKEVNLVRINSDSTVGAASMAAKLAGYDLNFDFKAFTSQLDRLKL